MHSSTLTRPETEAPAVAGYVLEEGEPLDYAKVGAEYARHARQMYEARPQRSVFGLLKLMWGVLRTGTTPKTYKL